MTSVQRKPIRAVQNGDGVPDWMAAHGIKPGEWLNMTKMQLRSKQRPGNSLKTQIWATGILHTAGYRGEIAVRMMRGEQIPLTPAHISSEIADVALAFYEAAGIDTDDLLKKLSPKVVAERLRYLPPEIRDNVHHPDRLSPNDKRLLKIRLLRWSKTELRRALDDLQDEGLVERRTEDGRLLKDLSEDELRRIGSGRSRLYFFLKPHSPIQQLIEKEWDTALSGASVRDGYREVEVDTKCSIRPSVRRILGVFGVEGVGRKQLADPDYQKRIELAYEEAKKTFLDRLGVSPGAAAPEVADGDSECPPWGDAECPPPVDKSSSLFERKDERRVESNNQRAAGGDLLIERDAPSTPETPPARPRDDLFREGLLLRRLLPDGDLLEGLRYVIGEMPVEEFFFVLDDRRKRGAIGTGLLMKIATRAREQWDAIRAATPPPPPPRIETAEERQRNIDIFRAVLADPKETEHIKEAARDALADYDALGKKAGGGS